MTLRMNRHHMRLHPGPFNQIAEGRKTYEFRLNDEKRRAIVIGDEIEFESRENPRERLTVVVESLSAFPSFGAMFDGLPQDVRDNRRRDEWVASFHEYYSEDEERRDGTLAIRFTKK